MLFIPRWPYTILLILITTLVILLLTVLKEPVLEGWFHTSTCRFIEVGSLPLISIVFTYFHIWLALFLTFYPVRYVGCCQIPGTNLGLGWQGIVPFKSKKMAQTAVRLVTERLLDVEEVFGRLDPVIIANRLRPVIGAHMETIMEEVAQANVPEIWASLPDPVKTELVEYAKHISPPIIRDMFIDMKKHIKSVFDIEHMVIDALTKDKDLLNQIFIRCGYAELCFIRNAGAWMGGIFGLIQAVIYLYYDDKWVLPTAGLIVGCITNWFALKMIFEPVEPIYLFCGKVKLHGLFLRRQQEVAVEYGRTLSSEVCNARNILSSFLTGPRSGALFDLCYSRIKEAINQFGGPSAHRLAALALGDDQINQLKDEVCERFVAVLPDCLSRIEDYADSALDMETTLREKLAALPSKDFESLLHPIFQEDEWKLILMGGALGVVIGLLQTYLINTGDC